MRILHVAYIYPPKFEVADGITEVVHNVAEELGRRGHHVVVYASDMLDLHGKDSIDATRLVINGVNVHYSRSLWRYKTFIVTPSIVPLLAKNIDRFDIIHIHDCRSFQGISTYLLAKAKNVPYVFQPHGSYLFSLPGSLIEKTARITLDKLISGGIFKNASKVIALSQEEAQQYRSKGVSEKKIEVIPNGINLSEYANLPPKGSFKRKFGIDDKEKIVLYLGRIHRIKGIDILIESFETIVGELNDVKLMVVGPNDGYLDEVKSCIKDRKMENDVLILGPLYGKDKLEAYVDADVYILPSRYETFPMSVLEAVACGTPIILTENCGTAEYFGDKVGLVVNPEPKHIAEALLEVLLDRDKQDTFRENCKAVTERFNISKTVLKLEEVYEEITK